MSSRFPGHKRSGGFSLAEVLVALAIASLMTTVLVRFVAGTRVNAARISEVLEMTTMAETILARVASGPAVQPGRTDGRAGDFHWRVEIQPVAFMALPRTVHERHVAGSAGAGAESTGALPIAKRANAASENSGAMAAPTRNWIPYRVSVAVAAPSGRTHVVDTVRIGPLAAQR
jgi:prepilin-type N-terminal cleavage/methylation domain-containing protein